MKKRWLIILIFMFVGLGILTSVTLPHQPSIKTESVRFSSGTYTVGKQIPVGVYKILPNHSDQSYTIKMAKTTIGNSTYNYDFSYNFK
ncbi:hypothetical protein, partial [Pseudomonas aeruginosa]|uniref:hypothetical protein n=1 Tax=Pseudomonas aeruginosa TaxID=287 RepID=UPI003748DF2C